MGLCGQISGQMSERIATTPFGGGRFGASDFQLNEWIKGRRAAIREGTNDTGKADKWELLSALTEARTAYGLGNATLRMLEVLLGFHQSREMDGAAPIVVFPSNRELSHRMRGMTDRNVRRHLRALVDAALLVRRDSPNGKRYCVRDGTGQVDEAFGFDLSPLALKASEIHEAAERAREHLRAVRKTRADITLQLRDISRIVVAALDEDRPGDWQGFRQRLETLSGRVGRFTPLEEHKDRLSALADLRQDVENAYLSTLTEQEMSANDGQDVRHIQNSNPESNFDNSYEERIEENAHPTRPVDVASERHDHTGDGEVQDKGGKARHVTAPVGLGVFRLACTEFVDLTPHELRSWRDVLAQSDLLRGMLGISADAMRKAESAMGPLDAAITVACILQRHEEIRSPGGYLRALTARAAAGKFSVRPMVDALIPK